MPSDKSLTEGDFIRLRGEIENALIAHFGAPRNPKSDTRDPDEFVYSFFRPDNDPGQSPDMNVDGSVTAVLFEVGFDFDWRLTRINVIINDNNMTSIRFGGLGALANGLILQVVNAPGIEQINFMDGLTLKANRDWHALAGVDANLDVAAGVDIFDVRWTVEKAGAQMLVPANWTMRITVQDNLLGLDFFRIMAQGIML